MASATGIVVVKRFTYRGDENEEWSNKYWLTGAPPTTDAAWRTLFDQVVDDEKGCYTAATEVVRGIGYNDNTVGAHSVWTVDLEITGPTVPGTLPTIAGLGFAGDQAGMVSWRTNRKNSRGKWIYLRKYFHGGNNDTADPDLVNTATHAAYDMLGQRLLAGSPLHSRRIRSQFTDEVLQAHLPSWYVTTRTLKRRGKRP